MRIGDPHLQRIAFRAEPYHVEKRAGRRLARARDDAHVTPVMVSGISQRSLERLTETLAASLRRKAGNRPWL